jgi:acetyl esterase/lipase
MLSTRRQRLSANAFHPDLQALSRVLPTRGVLPVGLAFQRRLAGFLSRPLATTAVAKVSATSSVRVHRPSRATTEPLPALLWIHGGGLIGGAAIQDDRFCRRMADEAGVIVVAVDHRVAPEDPYPAALDDCMAALSWLAQHEAVDASRIAIGGSSAGGGLAAAAALRARDEGHVRLMFQLLVYPMLDDRTSAGPDARADVRRLWDNRINHFAWSCYLAEDVSSGDVSPYAAAGRATDLSGLPPAWIGVGTLDLFHAEDVAYAERLVAAGVPCVLDEIVGAFHGFDVIAPRVGVSRSFRNTQIAALRSAVHGGPDTKTA